MTFLWPHALWLLLALPIITGAYLALRRRKRSAPLRIANANLVREAVDRLHNLRAHAPALLLLLALGALTLSVARPAIVTTAPREDGTVILLIDVSLSMAASDVAPTRLDAAKAAAAAFVKARPPTVRAGIVAFGGYADLVQPPTTGGAELLHAIETLELQRFTAIGAGLGGALLTLVPDLEFNTDMDLFGGGQVPERNPSRPVRKPVPPGSDLSRAIVLVSDGYSTMGVPPLQVAKLAADNGIRIYTVGVGTLYGGVAQVQGWETIHAEFDDATLKKIADVTDGEYFFARDVEKMVRIYERLSTRLILSRSKTEVTAVFVAAAAVLALCAAGFSFVWYNWPA